VFVPPPPPQLLAGHRLAARERVRWARAADRRRPVEGGQVIQHREPGHRGRLQRTIVWSAISRGSITAHGLHQLPGISSIVVLLFRGPGREGVLACSGVKARESAERGFSEVVIELGLSSYWQRAYDPDGRRGALCTHSTPNKGVRGRLLAHHAASLYRLRPFSP
jgi:hypothetical protein